MLRIDSPGGTVTGSDYLYHHLTQLVEEKKIPLVVSMGAIAASGGYYVAMAAGPHPKTIYAEPSCWTGSIGVIIPHYDISALLTKWDIQDDSIASHPLKQMGSPTAHLPEPYREQEREILKQLVDSTFDRFKQIVLDSRPELKADPASQEVVFTGRIFTAGEAKQQHLVDELGFVEDAINRAVELAGLTPETARRGQISQAGQLDRYACCRAARKQLAIQPGGRKHLGRQSGLAVRSRRSAGLLPLHDVARGLAKRVSIIVLRRGKTVMAERCWLLKTEPECFSIDDLAAAPRQMTFWSGVRNYQARNFMRDEMALGDRVLFYHSNAEPPAIVGTAVVVREGYPDHTAWDPKDVDHFDPKASPDNPIWQMVDIRLELIFDSPLPLPLLRQVAGLKQMELLRKGSRLSVQPVTPAEFEMVLLLASETQKSTATKSAARIRSAKSSRATASAMKKTAKKDVAKRSAA